MELLEQWAHELKTQPKITVIKMKTNVPQNGQIKM